MSVIIDLFLVFLIKAEALKLAHSSSTANKFYMSEELKKAMANAAHSWFVSEVKGFEEKKRENAQEVLISEQQEERLKQGEEELDMRKKEEECERLMGKMAEQVPKKDRVITSEVRISLVKTIVKASVMDFPITKHGKILDLFFLGNPVVRHQNMVVILRMIHLVNCKSRANLVENMIMYSKLIADESGTSVRDVELNWAYKACKSLDKMRTGFMTDFVLLSTFADINVEHDIKYFMNNKGLLNQLKKWYEMEKKRTDNRNRPKGKDLKTWMKERTSELEYVSAQDDHGNDGMVQLRENCEEWVMNNNDPEVESLNVNQENMEVNDEAEKVMGTDEESENVFVETESHQIVVKITPKKKPPKFTTKFDDDLKLKLLECYLLKAPDPMLSGATKGHHRLLIQQSTHILDEFVQHDGKLKRWREISTDTTMGNKLYRVGMSGQGWKQMPRQNGDFSTGLFSLVLMVLNQNDSLEKVRSSVDEVLEVAKSKVAVRN